MPTASQKARGVTGLLAAATRRPRAASTHLERSLRLARLDKYRNQVSGKGSDQIVGVEQGGSFTGVELGPQLGTY